MRKVMILFLSLIIGGLCYGATPLIFLGSSPENEANITSFSEIKLIYDLDNFEDDEYETVPGDIGMCYYAKSYISEKKSRLAKLYEGNVEDGKLISTIDTSYTPTSEGWTPSAELPLIFPNTLEIKPGQLYTIVITLEVYVSKAGSTTKQGLINYYNNPMILTFYGATSGIEQKLSFENCSIKDQPLENFSVANILFNHPIEKTETCQASLWEDGVKIADAKEYNIDESGIGLDVKFDEITAYYSHNYYVMLEEGSVRMTENNSLVNTELQIPFTGTSYHMFGVKSTSPRGGKSLLDRIAITFDFPDNAGIVYANNRTYPMQILKESGDALKTVNGIVETSNQTLVFYPEYSFDAGTTYKFVIDEDVVKAFDLNYSNAVQLKDYKCERIELSFSTPETSEMGNVSFAAIDTPEISSLDGFKISLSPYEYGGEYYTIKQVNTGNIIVPLVEITENSEKSIGDYIFYLGKGENESQALVLSDVNFSQYGLSNELLEGRNYRFNIPEGILKPDHITLGKYAVNMATSIDINGTARANFNVVINGSDGHKTETVVPRHYDLTLKFTAPENRNIEKVTYTEVGKDPIDITDEAKADAYVLSDVCNDAEFYVMLDEVKPEEKDPEFVNISLTVGHQDNHSVVYSHPTLKAYPASVNVSGANGWELESLTLNDDKDVTTDVKDGIYVVPAESLMSDAKLNAIFSYAAAPVFDFTTSVDGIVDGCDYKVYSDNEYLVIENVPANAQVSIYTVAGLKVVSDTNHGDTDIIRVHLNPGVYVVIINNDALKVKH